MAITATNLTTGNITSAASSATTASISPGANKLVIVAVTGGGAGTAVPTVTGASGTWVLIASQTSTGGARVTALFRDLSASPGSGALTIDFGGQSQTQIVWSINQFDGVDTSGTHGSGAIVQSVGVGTAAAITTGQTVTLAALGSANNAAMGFIRNSVSATIVAGTGFTELSNQNNVNASGVTTEIEWALNKTAVAWTWSSQNVIVSALAIEIKAGAAAAALSASAEILLRSSAAPTGALPISGRATNAFWAQALSPVQIVAAVIKQYTVDGFQMFAAPITAAALLGQSLLSLRGKASTSGIVPVSGRQTLGTRARAATSVVAALVGRSIVTSKARAASVVNLSLSAVARATSRATAAVSGIVPIAGRQGLASFIKSGLTTATTGTAALLAKVAITLRGVAAPSGIVPVAGRQTVATRTVAAASTAAAIAGRTLLTARARIASTVNLSLSAAGRATLRATSGASGIVPVSGRQTLASFVKSGITAATLTASLLANAAITLRGRASASGVVPLSASDRLLSVSRTAGTFVGSLAALGRVALRARAAPTVALSLKAVGQLAARGTSAIRGIVGIAARGLLVLKGTQGTNTTFLSAGPLHAVGINAPYGYSFAGTGTNLVANPTMTGGSAPSTLPTGWTTNSAGMGTVTATYAYGTETSLSYIEIALSGTPTAGGHFQILLGPIVTGVLPSTSYLLSGYVKLQAGAWTNCVPAVGLFEWNSGSGFVQTDIFNTQGTSGALNTNFFSGNFFTTTTTDSAYVLINVGFVAASATSVTLRLGLPNFSKNIVASSTYNLAYATWAAAMPSGLKTAMTSAGFNAVRLYVDPTPMLAAASDAAANAFIAQALIAVSDLTSSGFRVIFDFHIPLTPSVPGWGILDMVDGPSGPRFTRLIHCGVLAAQALIPYGSNVAFELWNEPGAAATLYVTPNQPWLTQLTAYYNAVRTAAPSLALVVTPADAGYPTGLTGGDSSGATFDPTLFDSNTLLSFHWYEPTAFSFQSLTGVGITPYNGPLAQYVSALEFPPASQGGTKSAAISSATTAINADGTTTSGQKTQYIADTTSAFNTYYDTPQDQHYIWAQHASILAWAISHSVAPSRIFQGEFGCTIDTATTYSRVAFLNAHSQANKYYGFSWSVHALEGGDAFQITDGSQNLVSALSTALFPPPLAAAMMVTVRGVSRIGGSVVIAGRAAIRAMGRGVASFGTLLALAGRGAITLSLKASAAGSAGISAAARIATEGRSSFRGLIGLSAAERMASWAGSGKGGGVVTLDANATAPFIANNSSTTTINFTNLTVSTSHSNYALVVQYHGNNSGLTSATWGVQAMTKIFGFSFSGQTTELWGLIAPQSGNQTLVAVLNGAALFCGLNASSWYNVNQTGGSTTFYNAASSTATGTAMSIAVSSFPGDVVIEVDGNNSTAGPHAPLGTQLFNGGAVSPAGSYLPGAGTVTLGWTAAASTTWGMVASGIAQSSVAGLIVNASLAGAQRIASFTKSGLSAASLAAQALFASAALMMRGRTAPSGAVGIAATGRMQTRAANGIAVRLLLAAQAAINFTAKFGPPTGKVAISAYTAMRVSSRVLYSAVGTIALYANLAITTVARFGPPTGKLIIAGGNSRIGLAAKSAISGATAVFGRTALQFKASAASNVGVSLAASARIVTQALVRASGAAAIAGRVIGATRAKAASAGAAALSGAGHLAAAASSVPIGRVAIAARGVMLVAGRAASGIIGGLIALLGSARLGTTARTSSAGRVGIAATARLSTSIRVSYTALGRVALLARGALATFGRSLGLTSLIGGRIVRLDGSVSTTIQVDGSVDTASSTIELQGAVDTGPGLSSIH